jgi:hypothetical protein
MSRIHNLLFWLGRADEERVLQNVKKIAGRPSAEQIIDSQGISIGLSTWPIYARRRKGCKYWPRGIAELD